MDDIITINGVEYIRKDCISKRDYDVLRNDVNNILKSAQTEIALLIGSYDEENEIKQVESRLVGGVTTIPKPKPKRKRRKYRKGSDPFEPNDFAKKKYNILEVMDDWTFRIHGSSNRKSSFDIRDVIKIKRRLENNISMNEAKQIAEDFGVSYSVFMKLSYNIEIGTFDEYIRDYMDSLEENNFPLKRKKIQIQNNPEKRRELGLS